MRPYFHLPQNERVQAEGDQPVETAGTSQTQLPAGERKDNCNPSRSLVARLAGSDIEDRLQQRDRFHGESFPFVPAKALYLDRANPIQRGCCESDFVVTADCLVTEPKHASLNHTGKLRWIPYPLDKSPNALLCPA